MKSISIFLAISLALTSCTKECPQPVATIDVTVDHTGVKDLTHLANFYLAFNDKAGDNSIQFGWGVYNDHPVVRTVTMPNRGHEIVWEIVSRPENFGNTYQLKSRTNTIVMTINTTRQIVTFYDIIDEYYAVTRIVKP